jgi:excisionase family DNA binding protein
MSVAGHVASAFRRSRPSTGDDQLLTMANIAGHIGAHESTVRLWIREGDLQAHRFGSRIGYRIRRSDYEAFLRRRSLLGAVTCQLLVAAPLE